MPSARNRQWQREARKRRILEQPVIRMCTCDACGAANPTKQSDPYPERCASCGTAMQPPPEWVGKTAMFRGGFGRS